jgi:hypothetical protein
MNGQEFEFALGVKELARKLGLVIKQTKRHRVAVVFGPDWVGARAEKQRLFDTVEDAANFMHGVSVVLSAARKNVAWRGIPLRELNERNLLALDPTWGTE